MTKGTPLSSQIIWLEKRVEYLEEICHEQKNELISIKRGQYFKENGKLKEENSKLIAEIKKLSESNDEFKKELEKENLDKAFEIAQLKGKPKKDTRWHPWNVSVPDVPPHGNVIVMLDNGETHSTHSDLVSWQKVCHHNDIIAWKWA